MAKHPDDKPASSLQISPSNCAVRLWSWLRQVTGDAAYDNYLQANQRNLPASTGSKPLLSRREFYLDALHRRYSSVSRCC